MNILYSTVNSLRDRYTPASHTSTFRKTGEITPEEFVAAGDYLVFKFPSWSWADAEVPSKRISHLPPGKQYLVTRHVPCHRRLDDDFAGDAGHEEAVVEGGGGKGDGKSGGGDDDDGWLRTGGLASSQPLKVREVRTVDDSGNVGDREVIEDDDDIPDYGGRGGRRGHHPGRRRGRQEQRAGPVGGEDGGGEVVGVLGRGGGGVSRRGGYRAGIALPALGSLAGRVVFGRRQVRVVAVGSGGGGGGRRRGRSFAQVCLALCAALLEDGHRGDRRCLLFIVGLRLRVRHGVEEVEVAKDEQAQNLGFSKSGTK
ncbi:hypothetical protein VTH06DRAFT_8381 [Thermothelomyces fergusii]